jgi:Lon-like protease
MSVPPTPRGRRRSRSAFYAASLLTVLWAALAVPLPLVEYVPGQPQLIAPMIVIERSEVTSDEPPEPQISMLTVVVREQPTLSVLAAWLDPDRRLLPADRVLPPRGDRSEYRQLQRERFSRQFDLAAAVGARAAGIETELVSEVVVVDVLEGSAADGVLVPGDVVHAVDGVPIDAAEALSAAVLARQVGDEMTLAVARNGALHDVRIVLGSVPGVDGARLGVTIQTAVDVIRLPFDLRLADDVRIGGPSAGLMIGLTVYVMLGHHDLVEGLTVAGTGSLDANGGVGGVGGVPEKVRAAIASGADVVLVPRHQLDEALAVSTARDVHVIGVATLEEAIEALRQIRSGDPRSESVSLAGSRPQPSTAPVSTS